MNNGTRVRSSGLTGGALWATFGLESYVKLSSGSTTTAPVLSFRVSPSGSLCSLTLAPSLQNPFVQRCIRTHWLRSGGIRNPVAGLEWRGPWFSRESKRSIFVCTDESSVCYDPHTPRDPELTAETPTGRLVLRSEQAIDANRVVKVTPVTIMGSIFPCPPSFHGRLYGS